MTKPKILLLYQPVDVTPGDGANEKRIREIVDLSLSDDSPLTFIVVGDRSPVDDDGQSISGNRQGGQAQRESLDPLAVGNYMSHFIHGVQDPACVGCVAILFRESRLSENAGNIALEIGYWLGQRGDKELMLLSTDAAANEWADRLAVERCHDDSPQALYDLIVRRFGPDTSIRQSHKSAIRVGILDNYISGDRPKGLVKFRKGLCSFLEKQCVRTQDGHELRLECEPLESFATPERLLADLKRQANTVDFCVSLCYGGDDVREDESRPRGLGHSQLWLTTGYLMGRRESEATLIAAQRGASDRSRYQCVPSNLLGSVQSRFVSVTWQPIKANYQAIFGALEQRCRNHRHRELTVGQTFKDIRKLREWRESEFQGWSDFDFLSAGYVNSRYDTDLMLAMMKFVYGQDREFQWLQTHHRILMELVKLQHLLADAKCVATSWILKPDDEKRSRLQFLLDGTVRLSQLLANLVTWDHDCFAAGNQKRSLRELVVENATCIGEIQQISVPNLENAQARVSSMIEIADTLLVDRLREFACPPQVAGDAASTVSAIARRSDEWFRAIA